MKNVVILWICIFFFASAQAQEFFIYHSPNNKKIESVVKDLAQLPIDSSYKISVPHEATNPNNEVHLWEGVSFDYLIKLITSKPLKKRDWITMIANDNYTVAIYYEDVLREKSFVATLRNKVKITHKLGEEQTVHPLSQKNNKGFYTGEWWPWLNKALVVGKLPPIIKFSGVELDLRTLKKTYEVEALPPYPVGKSHDVLSKDKVKITCVDIKNLPAYSNNVSAVEITTLTGNKQNVENVKDYSLCFKWNNQVIKPWLGGPVQLCQSKNPTKCFFYIRAMNFK